MELNIEFMKKYIIDNIAGTGADNRFIENLSNIALVKNEDIDKYENDVKCYIKQIIEYINNDKEKNGIKAIEDIFGFIKEFDFESGDGNFYLFVANVKIKAVALLCRMYLFIEKYHAHEKEELDKREENALKATKNGISEYIEYIKNKDIKNKDIKKLLGSLTEKYNDNESDKIGYYLERSSIDNKYKLSKDKDIESSDVYEMSPECKKSAQIILNLINEDVNLEKIDEIGEIISTINIISDKKIENKIAEFEEEKNMSEFLQKEKLENQKEKLENRSLRYFLFDNRMKEVEFFGVENQFNWLWEQEEKVCLYRNVTKKENNKYLEEKKSYGYMEALMNYIVSHASGKESSKANSYSRNPIRDFYKYIDFPKEESPYNFNFEIEININNASENKFEVEFKINDEFKINEKVNAEFEFIENATTNSLKITKKDNTEEEVSFYSYLKKSDEEYTNTKFCIEYCKENSIVPAESGRRLSKLNNYLHTWGIKDNFSLSKISDNDDEVITSTGYFSEDKVKNYNLNIGEIWAIMYKLYECEEPKICEKDSKLKEKIEKHFKTSLENETEKIKNEIKEKLNNRNRNSINQQLEYMWELDAGINVNIKINIDSFEKETKENMNELINKFARENELINKLNNKLNNIPSEIADKIVNVASEINSESVKETIDAIKKGIDKKKSYKNAREEDFKLYSKNTVLNFWKQLFKDVRW